MSYCRQHMKNLYKVTFGLICLLILASCADPPATYIPPAKELVKGADRYSCRYAAKYAYQNKRLKYFYWDIHSSQNYVQSEYATIYKRHGSGKKIDIKDDNGDRVSWVSTDKTFIITYVRSSGKLSNTKEGHFADCVHIEGPQKFAKKSPSSKSSRSSNSSSGSSGSGFFVTNRGHIITNYHVIENCSSVPQIKYKDQDVKAKIIAKDKILDLALLKANLLNTKYVTLSKDQPKKLQRIIASGYPFGKYISDDLKFTSGIISSLKGPNDDSTLVQVDAALNPGNSGGPIVDEESGKLVAVSVMGMKKSISEGQNFGIKTSSVKNFLEANQVKVPSSWFGAGDVAKLLENSTVYTFCR